MSQLDDLVNAFRALSPSDQQAFLKTVSPRGRPPLSRDLVNRATKEVLLELTTIDGCFFDDWLLKLTPEELEALACTPTRNQTLSLDSWKRTIEGWTVFKREGQEGFEAWATRQAEKLTTFKRLQMQDLLRRVEQRLGRKKERDHPPKGDLLKYVHEAKDEFLMAGCFTWDEIPPALRHKRQRGFRGDLATFYRQQHNYINNRGTDDNTPRLSPLISK